METILCAQPEHEGMPKHYHLAGEYDARLQRLEAFKARVEKAMNEVSGLPDGFRSELNDALAEVDA